MPENPQQLSEKLLSEGKKTIEFFQSIPPEKWDMTVYSEGASWVVRQILAHFVASEASILKLIENILAGGPGTPEDFDLNRYNERQVIKLQGVPVDELFPQFEQARQKMAAAVARMSAEDLEQAGRHPFLGVAPVGEIIKLVYRHNLIHQRDIRRMLS